MDLKQFSLHTIAARQLKEILLKNPFKTQVQSLAKHQGVVVGVLHQKVLCHHDGFKTTKEEA